MANKPIFVTQPSLPPLEEYVDLLKGVWHTGILTHNGPLVQRFENELAQNLGVKNFTTVTNGTIAIQMAIRALEIKGEIITTPFSWIATVSAIKYEGCKPVFCDINRDTLNIDVTAIEKHITKDTVAIMPVHVFGTPCDVEAIQKIADKHNLKVIYDAAHAIGSTYKNESVLNYGDVSATSLHGTKLLNTAEGGGCVTTNNELNENLKRIRFFGHNDAKDVVQDGFNGKMTEIHAALGLANLKYHDLVLEDRKTKYLLYKTILSDSETLKFQYFGKGESNYSYFPVIFKTEASLLKVLEALAEQHIYPRRYFYPSLNTYNHVVDYVSMPVSEDISKRILCLPLYYNLDMEDVKRIAKLVLKHH